MSTLTTTFNQLQDAMYDFIEALLPNRVIEHIDKGDYPKTNRPSVFITTAPFNGESFPIVEFDNVTEVETVSQRGIQMFTIDVVGGEHIADTQTLKSGLWSANFYKTLGLYSGLGAVTQGSDLTQLESGNMRGRFQFAISLHCNIACNQDIETYTSLQATICDENHENDCIDIDTENLPRCQ